jgi:D-galactose 1-dehydrogenase
VIGVGKIAIDQHLPALAKSGDFRLVGFVSQRGVSIGGVPSFKTAADLYAAIPEVEAVTVCTPPHVRHTIARQALAAGKHVMLEKPLAATVSEANDLVSAARAADRVIFSTWHSQYNAAVDEAKRRLAGSRLKKLHIEWREDVRHWHPGQDWIWEAGNFGVFDPGVNALSILTKITPGAMFVKSARLEYPENRDTPIAATLAFACNAADADAPLSAEFDWREEGDPTWNIDIETDRETLRLAQGGSQLLVNGDSLVEAPDAEYEGLYAHFAELVSRGQIWMDGAPFHLVADSFLIGSRHVVAPFHW